MARVTNVQPQRAPATATPGVRLLLVGSVAAVLMAAFPSLLVVAGEGWDQRSPQPGSAFKVGVEFVNVDVTVTDQQGRFVRDLGIRDFEVFEDGRPQTVSNFSLVDVPLDEDRLASAVAKGRTPDRVEPDVRSNDAEGGRVYVVILDDLHVDPLRSAQAKALARQFIDRYLGPEDLTAVLYTSGRIEASQEFTTSARLLREAVDQFVGRKLRSSVLERLEAFHRQPDEPTRADLLMQRIPDPLAPQRADQARSTLKTLTTVGELLARAQGRRKAVLFISEGLDYDLQMGVGHTRSGLTTFTSTEAPELLREMQSAIRATARANVSIYSVDPRGLAGPGDELIQVTSFPENPHTGLTPAAFQEELQRAQDSLRVLSEQTGGVASVDSNDFSPVLARIVGDNSRYYLLGYNSDMPRQDGRFRKIEVRVARPGVRVRARSGYTASPSAKLAGLLTETVEPSAMLRDALNSPLPLTALPLRIFAAAFKRDPQASVSIGIEVDARSFRFDQKDGFYVDRLDVSLVALDQQAKFTAGDRHSVNLRLKPDTYQAVQANGLRVLFRLNLPPGRFQLRAAAHESGSGSSGSVYYDLDVPDYAALPLAISGLTVTSTRAPHMPTARPDPLFEKVLPSAPTGARRFFSDETVTVLFEVTQGGSAAASPVDLVTTVRTSDGQIRFRSSDAVVDELRGGARGFGKVLPISLADLPPGPYILAVEARRRTSPDRGVAQEVPFEILGPRK